MFHSVIICTRNRHKDLVDVLFSLEAQTRTPEEIVVVDSSEDFKSLDLSKFPRIKSIVLHVPSSPGLTLQRNFGLTLVSQNSNLVHFFDDDVILGETYIQDIEMSFIESPGAIGICARTPDNPISNPKLLKRIFMLDSRHSGRLLKSGINVGFRKFDEKYLVDWLPGCCMSYRKENLASIRFDESRKNVGWGEDVDFSARVGLLGSLFCDPKLRIIHKLSPTNRDSEQERFLRDLESRSKLARVQHVRVYRWAVGWSLVGHYLLKLFFRFRLLFNTSKNSLKKAIWRYLHSFNSLLWKFFGFRLTKRKLVLKNTQKYKMLTKNICKMFIENRIYFPIRPFTTFELIGKIFKSLVTNNFTDLLHKSATLNKGLVCVKLTGGLGNQLFGWAVGEGLAKRKKVQLLFDLGNYSSANPREFELSSLNLSFAHPVLIKSIENKYLETHVNFEDKVLTLQPSIALEGYFQSWKYFSDIEEELRQSLLDLRKSQDGWLEIKGPFNAIQVRRGDYLRGQNPHIHGVLAKDYYINAVKKIQSSSSVKNFVLFSDDIEYAKSLARELNLTTVDEIEDSPMETLLRMSFASNFVISNSTFGWWAAWVGFNNSETTIVPSNWMNSSKRNLSEIYLPEWEILNSPLEHAARM